MREASSLKIALRPLAYPLDNRICLIATKAMSSGAATNAVPPWSNPGIDYAPVSVPAPSASAPAPISPTPEVRLNIEHDQASGSFVYKFVDANTGAVLQQFPSEQILELRRAAEYVAGRLINTKA